MSSDVAKTKKAGRVTKAAKTIETPELPGYIREWHELVEREPERFCEDIKQLKAMIEGLLARDDIWYDDTDVEAFIEFARLFRHKEGRWAGSPLELSIEQRYVVACVFGLKTYDEELDLEVRYFTELVLLVGRKWGKSLFISSLAAWMLMADREPSAQVWCLATKKAQAAIVYDNTKALLESSEVMTPPDNPRKYWRTKRDRDNTEMILFPATKSYMKPGGRNSQTQDGLNPHCYVIDECHAITDRNTYDVFTSATGARTQPLGIIISTFGFVRESIFDSILKRCEDRLAGKTQERLFPMVFRIDKHDDPTDRSCWIKANPGLREARPTMRWIEGEYQKALADPAQLPSFLAKHLNRAASSSVVYFNLHEVDQCATDMSIDMIRDTYAVGGIDASETTDLTCATALVPKGGRLYIFQRYFIAEQRIEQNSKQDQMAYESFTRTNAEDPIHAELLKICLGSMVATEDIAAWFQWLAEEFSVTFWKIGADRWHYNEVSKNLVEVGFMPEGSDGCGVTFSIPWGQKTLSEPMKQTRVLFKDKVFAFSRHNGLLRWCVTNVSAKVDANNNVMPDRRASKARIDGYASLLAAYVAFTKVKDDFEIYQK